MLLTTLSVMFVSVRGCMPVDVFLVPSVYFEVRKVWYVTWRPDCGENCGCMIDGFMGTTLVANADLSGFAFTTANDVETRNLPLLKEQVDDMTFRLCCSGRAFDGVSCGGSHVCCSPTDTSRGCTAPTGTDDGLKAYCSYKYGKDETAQGWKMCYGIVADMEKGVGCTATPDTQECRTFTNPLDVINAHNDWYDILDRNYKHHEKARNQMSAGKNDVVKYNEHPYSSNRYGSDLPAVEVRALEGMAPQHLIDLVTGFDGSVLKQEKQAEFATWNVIGFEGGGSSTEFSTDGFDCSSSNPAVSSVEVLHNDKGAGTSLVDRFGAVLSAVLPDSVGSIVGKALDYISTDVTTPTKNIKGTAGKCIHGEDVETSRDMPELKIDKEWTNTLSGGLSFAASIIGLDFSLSAAGETALTGAHSKSVTITSQITDGSTVMFHLEDPNAGDYFVVSVWSDPDFGTPLLSLDGGASSCQWEVGTAHRSAPTLEWQYIGRDVLGPDDKALFAVTLGNSINYYSGGPSENKYREGWTRSDGGYDAPDVFFFVDVASLVDGLELSGTSLNSVLSGFGKGQIEVLVQASRGPKVGVYSYPPPVLGFREDCGGDTGENKGSEQVVDPASGLSYYAIGMNNPERTIEFTQPCPQVVLTEPLQGFFFTTDAKTKTLDVGAFTNPSTSSRAVNRVFFDYREDLGMGFSTRWISQVAPTDVITTVGASDTYAGKWTPPESLADGLYEIRAVAECTEEASSKPFDSTTTPVVRGILDRTEPKLLSFTSSSMTKEHSPGDHFTLKFSEPIVCDGNLVDEVTRAFLDATLTIGAGGSAVYTIAARTLKHSCEGAEMTLSTPTFTPAASASLEDKTVSLTFTKGPWDAAGNDGTRCLSQRTSAGCPCSTCMPAGWTEKPLKNLQLMDGRAAEEQDAKDAAMHAKLDRRFAQHDKIASDTSMVLNAKLDARHVAHDMVARQHKELLDEKLDRRFEQHDKSIADNREKLNTWLKASLSSMSTSSESNFDDMKQQAATESAANNAKLDDISGKVNYFGLAAVKVDQAATLVIRNVLPVKERMEGLQHEMEGVNETVAGMKKKHQQDWNATRNQIGANFDANAKTMSDNKQSLDNKLDARYVAHDRTVVENKIALERKLDARFAAQDAAVSTNTAELHAKLDTNDKNQHAALDRGFSDNEEVLSRSKQELHAKLDKNNKTLHAKLDRRFSDTDAAVASNNEALRASLDQTSKALNDRLDARYTAHDDTVSANRKSLEDKVDARFTAHDTAISQNRKSLEDKVDARFAAHDAAIAQNRKALEDKLDARFAAHDQVRSINRKALEDQLGARHTAHDAVVTANNANLHAKLDANDNRLTSKLDARYAANDQTFSANRKAIEDKLDMLHAAHEAAASADKVQLDAKLDSRHADHDQSASDNKKALDSKLDARFLVVDATSSENTKQIEAVGHKIGVSQDSIAANNGKLVDLDTSMHAINMSMHAINTSFASDFTQLHASLASDFTQVDDAIQATNVRLDSAFIAMNSVLKNQIATVDKSVSSNVAALKQHLLEWLSPLLNSAASGTVAPHTTETSLANDGTTFLFQGIGQTQNVIGNAVLGEERDACEGSCHSNPGCKSYSYHLGQKTCRLSSKPGDDLDNVLTSTLFQRKFQVYGKPSVETTVAATTKSAVHLPGFVHVGQGQTLNLIGAPLSNTEKKMCEAQCADRIDCLSYSHHPGQQACRLSSSSGKAAANIRSDSSYRANFNIYEQAMP